MAELADALASGASGHYARGGSNPLIRNFAPRNYSCLVSVVRMNIECCCVSSARPEGTRNVIFCITAIFAGLSGVVALGIVRAIDKFFRIYQSPG